MVVRIFSIISFNGIIFSWNKFRHKEIERRSRINQNIRSFSEKCFACNKFGLKILNVEIKMNRYNVGRILKYFNGYCYTCNELGHKAC
jgi:hypothetical protein